MSRKLDVRAYKMTPEQLVVYAKETFGLELAAAAGRAVLLDVIQGHKANLDAQKLAESKAAKELRRAKRADAVPSGAARAQSAKLNQEIAEANRIAQVQAAMPAELRANPTPPLKVTKDYRVGLPQQSSVLVDGEGHPLLPDSDPVLPEELAFSDITNLVDEEEERKMQEKLAAFPQLRGKVGGLRAQTASEKPFRHPQHTKWLLHTKTKVYWPPTETLMRREDMIPIFEETLPAGSVPGA